MNGVLLACRLLLAAVFVLAAAGKLADLPGSRAAARSFGVPERLAGTVGTGLPLVELLVGLALLARPSAGAAAIAAAVLLAAFAAGMTRALARGEAPDCHCFGSLHSAPAGRATLARNVGLAALAIFVAAAGHGGGTSALAWLEHLSADELILLVGGVAAALAIGGLAAFSLALLRQQGRMLERLEALESGGEPPEAGEPRVAAPQGPPVGGDAPEVELEDLEGGRVTLADLRERGLPVVLVFTAPGCGPCTALLPEVAQWQREHAGRLTIAVISSGDHRAGAAEHGLTLALRQRDHGASIAYGARGTPSALVISADGRVASALVGGPDAIRALIEQALARPITLAPRPGDPAPAIELADLDGRVHRLGDSPAALLFFNPACGFCERMLPRLRERLAAPDAPQLVLVSRGSHESNRALELEATILLDTRGEAMAAYAAPGTPVALLVDEAGVIASEQAAGADAVFELLARREVGVV